ncbi:hypothetical protein B0A49_06113 [Cryomyces minteri]|uniref:Large ribosomal subunit protein mL54 n=1 Tax=Cryomyces minteri TaxID=331657 RepID=A0A4U0WY02_9PEZI|nr:hypothetical protein B0A49_06113 [Cryomyces minteri]
MICQRCLYRAAARSSSKNVCIQSAIHAPLHTTLRALSTSSPKPAKAISPAHTTSAAPRQGSPDSSHQPSAGPSTSAAQPFSTPLTPSPEAAGVKPGKPATPPVIALSSVVAGTPLKGLNFMKNKQDPVALEDSEYPSWLWGILAQRKTGKGKTEADGDLFSKSKKQRRVAAKKLRKQELLHPESLVPEVPIYEQSIDLPGGDGTVAGALEAARVREELRKAMRGKRRGGIKEDNFLRAMR